MRTYTLHAMLPDVGCTMCTNPDKYGARSAPYGHLMHGARGRTPCTRGFQERAAEDGCHANGSARS